MNTFVIPFEKMFEFGSEELEDGNEHYIWVLHLQILALLVFLGLLVSLQLHIDIS